MGGLSIWHILILAIILLLLFGGNRFSSMMGDVAKGLKSFKQGMADEDDDKTRRYDEHRRNEPPRQLPRDQKILFAPDKHLGAYLSRKTGREMLLWDGSCIVHEAFSERELLKLKAIHPDAPVLAHPECPAHILDHADHVGSTRSILEFALASPAETLIVATEPHIIHQMEKAAPGKQFIGAPGADGNCNCNMCPYMALNNVEKLYLALRDLKPQITLDEPTRLAALKPLQRMLDMATGPAPVTGD